MKLDIEQLKSEFKKGLNTQNWFKSVGKHSLYADKISFRFALNLQNLSSCQSY